MIPANVSGFVDGLKTARGLYTACPDCGNIFPLYGAQLFYGKEPPKELLYKMKMRMTKAAERVENLEGELEEANMGWEEELGQKDLDWRTRLDLLQERHDGQVGVLNERISGLKKNTAAANKEVIKEKVKEALSAQRSVIKGHIAELFPVFKKTKYHPADLLSLIPTTPIDFVIFEGLFQKEVSKIVFLDVKTGGSNLTHVQKTIRDTVRNGEIEFKKLKVDFDQVRGVAVEEN